MKKVICAIVLCLTLTTPAFGKSISLGGGTSNSHSEDDGNSCLNDGWFGNVSYDQTILSVKEGFAKFKLGGTFWSIQYTESDRENVNSKCTNTRRRTDNIITADGTMQFSIWRIRPFVKGSIGVDISKQGKAYFGIVPGINVVLTKSFSVEVYRTELDNGDKVHRIRGINIRYEF